MTDQKKLNIPDLSDVKTAHERISPHIHCTPILAVILKNPDLFRGKKVGVIITGGNVDLDKLPWITATGDKQ
jgi:threonine dehydratase